MRILFLLPLLFFLNACKVRKPFSQEDFLSTAARHHMLTAPEAEVMLVHFASAQPADVHAASRIAKKVNLEKVIRDLGLQAVNPDSSFSYIKYVREQLARKSETAVKPGIVLGDTDLEKTDAQAFLKELHAKDYISSSQYAKISDKIRPEPVLFPFMVFELLEITP
ncbi:MAG: hypothetical protein EOP49_18220 [Sphingobacteriales bacterium]|nr:MAG: hypothetical protein EOP49_18220 [Sphingobacteriales bacterium]